MRFREARHSTAALLTRLGANPAVVQKVMRHSDIRTTMEVYGHVGDDLTT